MKDPAPPTYMEGLDQVREFRNRHWSFTKEYILRHTRHPVATGGSPIVTWLPNQLGVVLMRMEVRGRACRGAAAARRGPWTQRPPRSLRARGQSAGQEIERMLAGSPGRLPAERKAVLDDLIRRAAAQRRQLNREVEELRDKYEDQDKLAVV